MTPFAESRHARIPTSDETRPSVDMLKLRLLLMLHDQFDAAKLRRMPASLLRESARRQITDILAAETPCMPDDERHLLIEELLSDAFGFGPLEELFDDPSVLEICVLGPYAVIARRGEEWATSSAKFRNVDHLTETLDRIRALGQPVGEMLPETILDVKLSSGFRAVAILPVASVGACPVAAFTRMTPRDSV